MKPTSKTSPPSHSSTMEALERLLYPEDGPVTDPFHTVYPNGDHATPEGDHATAQPTSFLSELSPIPEYPSSQVPDDEKDTCSAAPSPEIPGWHADEEEEPDSDDYGYPTGAPNHYMVVDALRRFTTLVNTIPSMEARIVESRCLLNRTESLLKKATPDARELTVTREYLETFFLAKMKKRRELWDGTAKMNKQDRKVRMAWLRAERKEENEKKWKKANELNAKHGLKPEPYSAFDSESDEEIESLLTTPASSRSGSSKRPREESIDAVGSDRDVHDTSQRKRGRS